MLRGELRIIRQHVPLDFAATSRASQHIRVGRPEAVPSFALCVIHQQRRLWCSFERFVRRWRRAADEMHESQECDLSVRSEALSSRVSGGFHGGDGNLENPISKRNSEVFHKSLSGLWIAIVEICR